jgi:hypothetical protein
LGWSFVWGFILSCFFFAIHFFDGVRAAYLLLSVTACGLKKSPSLQNAKALVLRAWRDTVNHSERLMSAIAVFANREALHTVQCCHHLNFRFTNRFEFNCMCAKLAATYEAEHE